MNSTTIINAINAKIKLIWDEIAFRNVFNDAHLMLSKIDIRNIMYLNGEADIINSILPKKVICSKPINNTEKP